MVIIRKWTVTSKETLVGLLHRRLSLVEHCLQDVIEPVDFLFFFFTFFTEIVAHAKWTYMLSY